MSISTYESRSEYAEVRGFDVINLRILSIALLVYALGLTALVLILSPEQKQTVFSERGPFEMLSIPLWLMLAAWCFAFAHEIRKPLVVCGLLALFAAAREADWHKAFTADSIFKSNYYFDSPAPLTEKVPAGMVALFAFALIFYWLYLGIRFLRSGNALQHQWMQTLVLGTVTVFASKILDRMISWAHDWFGLEITGLLGRFIGAYEEGFEMSLPIIFGIALIQYRRAAMATRSRRAAVLNA